MPHSRQAVAATVAVAEAATGVEAAATVAEAVAATGVVAAASAAAVAATATADCADAHYHRSGSRDSPED